MSTSTEIRFTTSPVMLAAWPGLGNVGMIAVDYLRRKLDAEQFADMDMRPFFVPEAITVRNGKMIKPRPPESSFHYKKNPDLVFFESDSSVHGREGLAFTHNVLSAAKKVGVKKIITAAAIPVQSSYHERPQLFYAATNEQLSKGLEEKGLRPLPAGEITGPAGLLPTMAANHDMEAACILVTMPAYAGSISYPKAALEVIRKLQELTGAKVDLSDLENAVEQMDDMFRQMETQMRQHFPGMVDPKEQDRSALLPEYPAEELPAKPKKPEIPEDVRQRIEELFAIASNDKSKAKELKAELDKHRLFAKYEKRFLDLFRE